MTPSSPPGPSTGTDHELATLADRARSPKFCHEPATVLMLSSMTGACRSAASPTGPPADPNGSRAHASSSRSGTPKDAVLVSWPSSTRWMQSRSLPSAAPSADKISDRLEDGSEETSRPVSPCSRVSCRRAEEPTAWPAISAITSSGCTSSVLTSVTTRPCRSTTIRSDSRNISPVSWQDSRIVVPCSRSRVMSRSTSAASCMPSDAVGSSSSSSRGLWAIARATDHLPLAARQRPDRQRGVPHGDTELREQPGCLLVQCDVGEHVPAALVAEHHVRRHVEILGQREILPDDPDPQLGGSCGNGCDRAPADPDRARGRRDVPGDGPDQRGLPGPVLAGQRHHLPGP